MRNMVPALKVITAMILNATPPSGTSGPNLAIELPIPWRNGFDVGFSIDAASRNP
jgi:hypothetical protein